MKWYCKLPLFKEAYRQGGIDSFPLAQKDILETMADDLDKKSDELAENKLAALLSPMDFRSIVTLDQRNGIVYVGGEKASEGTLSNLKAEAEFFLNSELWKLIHESAKDIAQKQMFVSSESLADLQKGKSILFCLASQKKILDILKSYQPKK